MDTTHTKPSINTTADLIILVLVFGVMWGLFETVSGNLFQMTKLPFRTAVITGAGMGIMGCSWGITKRPLLLPFIAIVAAASVQLSAPILNCSLMCKANANLAVILHGAMLSALSITAARVNRKGVLFYAAVGFGAALFSSSAFYHLGLRFLPCAYLLSFSAQGGFVQFLMREGIPWACCSAILFPAGVFAGNRILKPLSELRIASPRQFFGGATTMIVTGILLIAASIQYWR